MLFGIINGQACLPLQRHKGFLHWPEIDSTQVDIVRKASEYTLPCDNSAVSLHIRYPNSTHECNVEQKNSISSSSEYCLRNRLNTLGGILGKISECIIEEISYEISEKLMDPSRNFIMINLRFNHIIIDYPLSFSSWGLQGTTNNLNNVSFFLN